MNKKMQNERKSKNPVSRRPMMFNINVQIDGEPNSLQEGANRSQDVNAFPEGGQTVVINLNFFTNTQPDDEGKMAYGGELD